MTGRRPSPPASASDPGPLLVIGTLARAHGLQGEICLNYYAESPEWLNGPLWLRAKDTEPARRIRVAGMRLHRGRVLIRLEGVEDRTAAEQLRGLTVLMPESRLPESDAETMYLHDLIGLDVLLHAGGERLGVRAGVSFIGGQELWDIEAPDGKEILFPGVPDFVDVVELEHKIIRISPPPGLLDLYVA
jgi:16S rRNA processing protein RimM